MLFNVLHFFQTKESSPAGFGIHEQLAHLCAACLGQLFVQYWVIYLEVNVHFKWKVLRLCFLNDGKHHYLSVSHKRKLQQQKSESVKRLAKIDKFFDKHDSTKLSEFVECEPEPGPSRHWMKKTDQENMLRKMLLTVAVKMVLKSLHQNWTSATQILACSPGV